MSRDNDTIGKALDSHPTVMEYVFAGNLDLSLDEILERLERRFDLGEREWQGHRILYLMGWVRYLQLGGKLGLEVFIHQRYTLDKPDLVIFRELG